MREGCTLWICTHASDEQFLLKGSVSGRRRCFGLARKTVRKMLRYATTPGYRRTKPVRRPKLDPYTGIIDQILLAGEALPKKQRHTAQRIFERLRDEHGFAGGYTIIKDYVRLKRTSQREMFVPLVHRPGHAQEDFGEAQVEIGGVLAKAHYFVIDLPHSDESYVRAFPAETTEAFLEGHVEAFRYWGGVPRRILYDNTTLAVARILGDGTRLKTRAFSELQSHYLFEERFGRPGKGNDKGKVENLVKVARRSFFVPRPRFPSWEALNVWLEEQCRKRRERRQRGHQETIGECFERDRGVLLPLPAVGYEACETRPGRVTSLSLVRYHTNDYSVPTEYGHRQVLIKGYVNEVVICAGSEEIARHRRSYGREELIFHPLHYLALPGIINIYQNNTWVKSAGGMRICSDLEDERKHLLNQMFPTLKKCGCGTAAHVVVHRRDGGKP